MTTTLKMATKTGNLLPTKLMKRESGKMVRKEPRVASPVGRWRGLNVWVLIRLAITPAVFKH